MPIKKRGGHLRGAARRQGEGRKTGKGSVRPGSEAGFGRHRDAAPSGSRDGAPRSFGSRKPKGSFGARDSKAHGFRRGEAGEPRSFEGRDKPRTSFGDRKSKGSIGRRDEKPRSQVGPRWRNDAPVESRGGPKSNFDARKPRDRAPSAARPPRERTFESRAPGARTFEQRPPRDIQPSQEPAPRPLPEIATGVQTVTVGADEAGMRVDRFFEAKFPGLSFSHIQRIVRKGEVRVDSKRVDTKDRLAIGQQVRIPPLKLNVPKRTALSPEDEKTRDFLKSITLHEDADVLVLNKP